MSHAAAPAPAPASSSAGGPARDKGEELATQIYVQLVARALTLNGTEPELKGSAESYVKLSLKLAETFFRVDQEIKTAAGPKSAHFDVDKLDFNSWTKPG